MSKDAPVPEKAPEQNVPPQPRDPSIAQSVDPANDAPAISPAPPPVGEPAVDPASVQPTAPVPVPEPPVVQTKLILSSGGTLQAPGVAADDFDGLVKDASGFVTLENGVRVAVAHIVSYE